MNPFRKNSPNIDIFSIEFLSYLLIIVVLGLLVTRFGIF